MKRLIVFSVTGFLIVATIVLLMRVGPGASPAQAQDPPPMPTPAEQLAQAAQLKDQKNWEDALTILRQVATRRAEDEAAAAQGQLRQGEYLLQMALPAQAESELRRVLVDFPNDRDAADAARLFLSDALAFQGKKDLALQEAQTLAQDASAVLALRGWGFVRWANLLRNAGRADDAVTVLDQLAALPWPIEDAGPKIEGGTLQARILVDREHFGPAATALEQVITSAAGDAYAQQRNWARVFLAQVSLNLSAHSRVQQVTDDIIADHAAGKANDEQVAWGLIWKARSHKQLHQYARGLDALQMAVAVAYVNCPPVAFEAQFELGDVCAADGNDVQAAGGDWGPLHEQALAYYMAAFDMAKTKQLGEDRLDRARLQIGSEMRHMGMRERGIAWLRMGIEDPARITGSDELLAQRMVSFMSPLEAEAWHHYMLAPTENADPTQAMVQKEFEKTVPAPSSAVANQPFLRLHWLGRLYEKQRRFQEAMTVHQQSQAQADTPDRQAEALAGQARAARGLAQQARGSHSLAEYESAKALMIQTAEAASAAWAQVAVTAKPADSHYAIEQAVMVLREARQNVRALEVAEALARGFGPEEHPSKQAFARYMRIQALAWNHQYDQAVTEARGIDQEYAQYPDANLQEVRVAALIRSSAYSAQSGAPEAGLAILAEVEARYPQRYQEWISTYRKLCEDYVVGQ
jgi:tetratricopeptide (TPR) repeat protein